jgi:PTH1 family peptidyl-tRNA hydrolase
VIDCFGTNLIPRLRLGVRGDNFQPGEPLDTYVLSRFSKKERPAVDEATASACEALTVFVTEGIDAAMNRFNRSPEEDPAS